MNSDLQTIGWVAAALVTAMVVALITTPVVKSLAFRVGAVDVPKDNRRLHDHPIPRMGGLAIFFGFLLSVLIYVELTPELTGMLLGGVIIVVLGIFDDIYALGAKFKLMVQIAAALVAVLSGNVIEVLSNPNVFSSDLWWELGWLAYPVTIIWIVAITNAVNLIDGLDGLACGGSTGYHGRPGGGLHRLFALQPESGQDFHGGHRVHLPGVHPGGHVHSGPFQILHHHFLRGALPDAGPAHL